MKQNTMLKGWMLLLLLVLLQSHDDFLMMGVQAFVPPHSKAWTLSRSLSLSPPFSSSRLYGLRDEWASLNLPIELPDLDKTLQSKDIFSSLPSSLPSLPTSLPQFDAFKSFDPTSVKSVLPTVGSGGDDTLLYVGGGVLVVGLLAAIVTSVASGNGGSSGGNARNKSKKKPKPNPLAIPYDAAARLAYQEFLDQHNSKSSAKADGEKDAAPKTYVFDEEAYTKTFRPLYEAHAVAEATAKARQRDLMRFDNTVREIILPPLPSPRRESSSPQTATIAKTKVPFFFAKPKNDD